MSDPPSSVGRTVRAKAKTVRMVASTCAEVLKTVGIVVSLALAWWANCTKADESQVERAVQQTDLAIDALNINVEKQHDQTEKIRETVEGTSDAVRAIANAPAAPVTVSDKEPKGPGCWTVYGGIVRCKTDRGTAPLAGVTLPVKVELPPVPPAVPAPQAPDRVRGDF